MRFFDELDKTAGELLITLIVAIAVAVAIIHALDKKIATECADKKNKSEYCEQYREANNE